MSHLVVIKAATWVETAFRHRLLLCRVVIRIQWNFVHYDSTMEILTFAMENQENETVVVEEISTFHPNHTSNGNTKAQSILIIQSTIASVGIIANLTVIVVFLNHKKLRRKIPNIFIVNQVRMRKK